MTLFMAICHVRGGVMGRQKVFHYSSVNQKKRKEKRWEEKKREEKRRREERRREWYFKIDSKVSREKK